MPRVRLTLAYDGTRFHGWQIQDVPGEKPRTVQGVVEKALARITGETPRIHGAGRTDAGVHALDQNAHFDAPESMAELPWQKALNALLPKDVRVMGADTVDAGFHSRFNAISKTYAYSFWLDSRYVLPQRRHFTWHPGPLDESAMLEAAELIIGSHDFAGFQNTGTEVGSTVRTVSELAPGAVEDLDATRMEMVWRISADGFLKQMARNIFGLLAAVGRGRLEPSDAAEILDSRDRTRVHYATAPARGLTLAKVRYE